MIPTVEYSKNENAQKGIEIIDLAELYSRKSLLNHDPSKPHQVRFYLLTYISQGYGEHFIDFERYSFNEGSFIFINKDQTHAFDFSKKPEGKVIIFNQNFVDDISSKLRMPIFSLDYLLNTYYPVFTIDNDLKRTCNSLLDEITQESNRKHIDQFIIELLFSALLLILIRERPKNYHNKVSKQQADKIHHFLNLVELHSSRHRNVVFYANKMGLSYKQLNQLCKSICKNTAKHLIDSHIIIKAKRHLAIEETSVKEVGYELGFDEISNFIKFFKKHTKHTPAQFKKLNIS